MLPLAAVIGRFQTNMEYKLQGNPQLSMHIILNLDVLLNKRYKPLSSNSLSQNNFLRCQQPLMS